MRFERKSLDEEYNFYLIVATIYIVTIVVLYCVAHHKPLVYNEVTMFDCC